MMDQTLQAFSEVPPLRTKTQRHVTSPPLPVCFRGQWTALVCCFSFYETTQSVCNSVNMVCLLCFVLLICGAAPLAAAPAGSSYLAGTGEWKLRSSQKSGELLAVYCRIVPLFTEPHRRKRTARINTFGISARFHLARRTYSTFRDSAVKGDVFLNLLLFGGCHSRRIYANILKIYVKCSVWL